MAIAASSATTPATTQNEQFLSFTLPSNMQVILPTQKLTEVLTLTPQQIVPIPDLDPQVMGVCNWRGEVLWIVDLAYLLNGEPLPPLQGSHYTAIILHHEGQTLGLVVSQVTQMVWCDPTAIQPLPATKQMPQSSPLMAGYWLSPPSDTFIVLNTPAIFDCFQR